MKHVVSFSGADGDEIHREMVRAKRFDAGSCSESCELLGNEQVELGFEVAV